MAVRLIIFNAVEHLRLTSLMMFVVLKVAATAMAFSISVLFPGGEPHSRRQKPANSECHRSHRLNLARIDPDKLILIVELNEAFLRWDHAI